MKIERLWNFVIISDYLAKIAKLGNAHCLKKNIYFQKKSVFFDKLIRMEVTLTTPPAFEKTFYNFHDKYEMLGHSFDPKFTKEQMKPKWQRVCRFCGRSKPDTTFKSDAHLIPEQLGNTMLFSDFECHECNLRFGKYESQLAEFLGISRTLAFTRNKGKVPTFRSADDSLRAKHDVLNEQDYVVVSRSDAADGSIISDIEKGSITATYTKKPYIPASVYRAFLKMALSVIDGNEVNAAYKIALDFLNNTGHIKFICGAIAYGFEAPFQLAEHPYFYLFKKKKPDEPIHTHFLILYFQKFIIGFPVPFHKQDLSFYGNPFQVLDFPPMLPQHQLKETTEFKRIFIDLNSEERVTGEKEQINITFDPAQAGVSAAYSPLSGKVKERPFDAFEITEIIITGHAGNVALEELHQAVKKNSIQKPSS